MDFLADTKRYALKEGDSITDIAEAEGVTVKEVAFCNWGSDDDAIVGRALFEEVGCRIFTEDWQDYRFTGDESERGSGEILIPERVLKKNAVMNQSYSFSLRTPRPARAVSIVKLDKWFAPGQESCDIKWAVEGEKHQLGKLDLEVYGSHYCYREEMPGDDPSLSTTAGLPRMVEFEAPVPLFSKHYAGLKPKASKPFEWDGKVAPPKDAKEGVLATDSVVNVAFSPYTLLLRHYVDSSDAQAMLQLEGFWPRWQESDSGREVDSDSLVIRWKISGCENLDGGQLIIVDRSDKPVFRKALNAKSEEKIKSGDHSFAWDGILDDGNPLSEEEMPYRVQLQLHTHKTEAKGLALAAFHTEVRLFAEPHATNDEQGDDQGDEPNFPNNAMDLTFDYRFGGVSGRADIVRWGQYKLAMAGYHPGPIDGELGDSTKTALREFQRSVPLKVGPIFKRLPISETFDQDTCAALDAIPVEARPLFADGNDERRSISSEDAAFFFGNPNEKLILWIDDRNYYTDSWSDDIDDSTPQFLKKHRRKLDAGDALRLQYDRESIARPWIQLRAEPYLAKKDSKLKGIASQRKAKKEVGQQALGPLRVNWNVRDLKADHDGIDIEHPGYLLSEVRSKKFMEEIARKHSDEQDGVGYHNCPESLGGLRPTNEAGETDVSAYYRLCFSSGGKVRIAPDDQQKTMYSFLSSSLAKDGEEEQPSTAIGQGRAWFRPSIIAGDGYRIFAEINFDDFNDDEHTFPNQETLRRRYPDPPRAVSAGLRLWRRAAYRGHLQWSSEPANRALAQDGATYYKGAFIHFERSQGELGESETPGPDQVFNQADYADLVGRHVTDPHFSSLPAVFDEGWMWPFIHAPQYGLKASGPNVTLENAWEAILKPARDKVIRQLEEPLAVALLEGWERRYGALRGNIIGVVDYGPTVVLEELFCSRCLTSRVDVVGSEPDATPPLAGERCGLDGCNTGPMLRYDPPRQDKSLITRSSVAFGCGWVWLSREYGAETLAHEVGHTRHLEHSPSFPGELLEEVAGAKPDQHDHQPSAYAGSFALSRKNACWDRRCVMSYAEGAQFFCGPCLLKMRGWAVEGLSDLVAADISHPVTEQDI